jgi:hypothetical protein
VTDHAPVALVLGMPVTAAPAAQVTLTVPPTMGKPTAAVPPRVVAGGALSLPPPQPIKASAAISSAAIPLFSMFMSFSNRSKWKVNLKIIAD